MDPGSRYTLVDHFRQICKSGRIGDECQRHQSAIKLKESPGTSRNLEDPSVVLSSLQDMQTFFFFTHCLGSHAGVILVCMNYKVSVRLFFRFFFRFVPQFCVILRRGSCSDLPQGMFRSR